MTKNQENLQSLNHLIKFSEIWYVDASQRKKMPRKNCFLISAFFCLFGQKQSKLIKNEKNRQNLNCLIKFSEIWYVDNKK